MTMFCTWVTSLVRRVTSEPVEKRSVCWKERFMMRLNRSLRRSLPKPCAAMLANTPHSTPDKPPASTVRIIFTPMEMISAISLFSTPLSTISAIMSGWIRSIATSPAINRGASRQQIQYFFTYFSMRSYPF